VLRLCKKWIIRTMDAKVEATNRTDLPYVCDEEIPEDEAAALDG
jgi:hypothetical protein